MSPARLPSRPHRRRGARAPRRRGHSAAIPAGGAPAPSPPCSAQRLVAWLNTQGSGAAGQRLLPRRAHQPLSSRVHDRGLPPRRGRGPRRSPDRRRVGPLRDPRSDRDARAGSDRLLRAADRRRRELLGLRLPSGHGGRSASRAAAADLHEDRALPVPRLLAPRADLPLGPGRRGPSVGRVRVLVGHPGLLPRLLRFGPARPLTARLASTRARSWSLGSPSRRPCEMRTPVRRRRPPRGAPLASAHGREERSAAARAGLAAGLAALLLGSAALAAPLIGARAGVLARPQRSRVLERERARRPAAAAARLVSRDRGRPVLAP